MTQKENIIAYLAGFFDGEGSITIDKRNRTHVRVSQNLREPLELFKEYYGGGIYKDRAGFQLVITKRIDVLFCLKQLEPYLIVKKSKALFAISHVEKLLLIQGPVV